MLTAPRTAMSRATTTNVYVRRRANRTIHMASPSFGLRLHGLFLKQVPVCGVCTSRPEFPRTLAKPPWSNYSRGRCFGFVVTPTQGLCHEGGKSPWSPRDAWQSSGIRSPARRGELAAECKRGETDRSEPRIGGGGKK